MRLLLIAGHAESVIPFRGALLAALQRRHVEVHVAAPNVPTGDATRDRLEALELTVHDIPLRRTGTNPLADLRTLGALVSLMRDVRPDVVLAYTIKPVIYGSVAASIAGVPRCFALITGLGYAFIDQSTRRGLQTIAQRMYAFALGRVDKVFFQNPDDEALFRKLRILGAHTPSRVLNGSGVDIDRFTVAPLPQGAPRFLLIARLLGDKGVREYVEAARRIRANHADVRFDLAGFIDENPDSVRQEELDGWIADGAVNFLGRLADVRPAIEACSVYVLPSYREGTPRTVLEAMAMGRAVITTDAPGCRETVVDGVNGYLVEVKSVEALVTTMERFIGEPARAITMGRASRRVAEEKYDVRRVNAMMLREMGIE